MATKIVFIPKQPDAILDMARKLTPPGFELVVVDQDTPEFYEAIKDAEYVMGLGRPIAGEFFRAAPKLKLVQLLSAGYDRVDIESARKAHVPVANNGGANAIAVSERSEEHTSELQSHSDLVCRLLLEKKNTEHCRRCFNHPGHRLHRYSRAPSRHGRLRRQRRLRAASSRHRQGRGRSPRPSDP